jgi:hypothetical protein
MIQQHYSIYSVTVSLALFLGMLAAIEGGARWALHQGDEKEVKGAGIIEGAVFALLGLLIALTFTGAAERFNARSMLTIDESDALGTMFTRLEILPEPGRGQLQRLVRGYTAARLEEFEHIQVPSEHALARGRTAALRNQLWAELRAAAAHAVYPNAPMLLLPPLDQAFSVADRREAVRRIHPAGAVYAMLVVISLLSATLAGYGFADRTKRRWLHRLSFAGATAVSLFVTINMDHPRLGVIRMGNRDQVLQEALAEMDSRLAQPASGTPPATAPAQPATGK